MSDGTDNVTIELDANETGHVAAVIDKADIATCGAAKGGANIEPVIIRGRQFDPLTVRYLGFRGQRGDDGRYHGVHVFGWPVFDRETAYSCSFARIPGLSAVSRDARGNTFANSETGIESEDQ